MKITTHAIRAALLASGLLVAACGGSPSAEEGTTPDATMVQYEGPITSEDVVLGEERFAALCAACHDGGGAPELANHPEPVAFIRMQVREGSGQMPPIGANRLSDQDLEAVLAYMVTIGAVEE